MCIQLLLSLLQFLLMIFQILFVTIKFIFKLFFTSPDVDHFRFVIVECSLVEVKLFFQLFLLCFVVINLSKV